MEEQLKIANRRAHSKNDKYPVEGAFAENEELLDLDHHAQSMNARTANSFMSHNNSM
jgi:hypothetical protein